MQISADGLNLIAGFEGLSLTAYQDTAGVWTIGYGHTPAVAGQVIALADAMNFLLSDCQWAQTAVNNGVQDVPTTQHQFDAMTSLCFNIGAPVFATSHVLLRHRQGNFVSAAADFPLFDKEHNNGVLVTVPGLLDRRQKEAAYYMIGNPKMVPLQPYRLRLSTG